MSELPVGHWAGIYVCVALVVMAVGSLFADRLGTVDPPSPVLQATLLVTAGALWPVIVAGLAQLAIAHLVVLTLRRRERITVSGRSGTPEVLHR